MSKTTDWLPPNRIRQLIMAKDWKGVMAAKLNEWNIPAPAMAGFEALVQRADSALCNAAKGYLCLLYSCGCCMRNVYIWSYVPFCLKISGKHIEEIIYAG